ncbi:hypothetical protein POM88_048302 [Heracleum sosnowskyi]|uniref:PB1-like domain-containing protein n=1 Tax=Heracleum sosnowskyi TaxID=360622 RepID=A0AAD8GVX8_9APIA|nr:hypothetical protein POM88_048302 [Heracleum sosnowskyi]
MSNRVLIHLHHHGEFTPNSCNGNVGYVGGVVEVIDNVDTDTLTFFDFEDYALKYDFSKDDFLYFLTDGRSFKGGVRLPYDDESVRNLVSLSLRYKKIDIYVHHQKRPLITDMPKHDDLGGGSVSNSDKCLEDEDD